MPLRGVLSWDRHGGTGSQGQAGREEPSTLSRVLGVWSDWGTSEMRLAQARAEGDAGNGPCMPEGGLHGSTFEQRFEE